MRSNKITEEGRLWLCSQDPSLTYKELTALYNENFNSDITWYGLRSYFIRNTNISRTSKGGQFKNGHDSYSTKPIGSECVTSGKIWIKVTDDRPEKCKTKLQLYKYQWRLKHRFIWEQAYGPIPDDAHIIFLDRNPMNCTLDNLYLVSRRVNAIMNKQRWFDIEDPTTFKTALRCAELISIVTSKGGKK